MSSCWDADTESGKSHDALARDSLIRATTVAPSGRLPAAGDLALHAVLVLLSLVGAAVVLLSTSRYGAGSFPDSALYLSAAKSLLAGEGYQYYFGETYTRWPPLYPTLLAAFGLAGVDPYGGARWLNSVAFGLIVFLSGRLFLHCTTSRALVLAATLSVLAAKPLLEWSVVVASEPVFTLLVLLFALFLVRFLRDRKVVSLLLASIFAALACLQRYAGASVVLAGLILIASSPLRVSWRRRLIYLVLFGIMATTPIASWYLRNHLLAGATLGHHDFHLVSWHEVREALRTANYLMATWLMPWVEVNWAWPIRVAPILGLAGVMIVLSRVRGAGQRQPSDRPAPSEHGTDTGGLLLWSAAMIVLTYVVFVAVCGAGLNWRPEQRLLVPMYTFVVAIVVAGIEALRWLLPVSGGCRRALGVLGLILGALWLQYPVRVLYSQTIYRMQDGAGGHATVALQNSPTVAWLRAHPLWGRVFSNVPETVYLLTGLRARPTPQAAYVFDPAEFAGGPVTEAIYIVWLHDFPQVWLYDLREILSQSRTQELATFPDGSVYQYLGEGGPGMSAVYRFWSRTLRAHFYTARKEERYRLLTEGSGTWEYEGPVFYAYAPDGPRPRGLVPVYRFWSTHGHAHFYTMQEYEKDRLLLNPSGAWTCEGVAFYVWPRADAQGVLPVYRFSSDRLSSHFFTLNESEMTRLASESPGMWTCEGIAWYAHGP